MSRIVRSTDVRAALRSRQRGFLLNPFRFGGGGGGPSFDYVAFLSGKSGDAWLANGTHYTDTGRTTVANVNDTIASLSGAAGAFNASQSTSTARPTLLETSGKRYLSFDGGDGMAAGANSDWNYLHNAAGNACICAAYRFGTSSDPNAAYAIVATESSTTAQTGLTLLFDDRAFVPSNNALRCAIDKSVSGTPAFAAAPDNVISPQTDVVIEFVKSGTSITVRVNGTAVASGTASSPATGNSTAALNIGILPNGTLPLLGRIYGLLVCNAVPSSGDQSSIRSDMASRCVMPPI